jgi:hypothetical protein
MTYQYKHKKGKKTDWKKVFVTIFFIFLGVFTLILGACFIALGAF